MRALLLAALAVGACASPPVLKMPQTPVEMLIWAAVDANGRTYDAGKYLPNAPAIALPLEDRLIVWNVPAGGLIDRDGALDPDEVAAVEVHVAGDGAPGDCGRCQAPSRTWPQPLLPGDGCNPPPDGGGIVHRANDGQLEEVPLDGDLGIAARSAVLLVRSGECECRAIPAPSLDGIELELRPGADVSVELEAVADGPGGERFGVLPEGVWYDDGTAPRVIDDPRPLTVVESAIVTRDGSYWAVERDPTVSTTRTSRQIVRHSVGEGGLVSEPAAQPAIVPIGNLLSSPTDPQHRVFMIGFRSGSLSSSVLSIITCDDALENCAADPPPGVTIAPLRRTIDVRTNGMAYATTPDLVLWQSEPRGQWEFRPVFTELLAPDGELTPLPSWISARFGEQVILACAVIGSGGVALVRVPYDAAGDADLDRAAIVAVERGRDQVCNEVFYESGPTERFWVWKSDPYFPRGSFVELDGTGAILSETSAEDILGPVREIHQLSWGSYYGRDDNSNGYFGPSPDRLTRRYGQGPTEGGAAVSVVSLDAGRIAVVSRSGQITLVDERGARRLTDPQGVLPQPLFVASAAYDPGRSGGIVVASHVGVGWIGFDDAIRSYEAIAPGVADAMAVTAPSPGQLLVATAARAIKRIDLDGVVSDSGQIPGPPSGERLNFIRAQSRSGVTWVMTNDGVLMRGVADQWAADALSETSFGSMNLRCPDDLLILGNAAGARIYRFVPPTGSGSGLVVSERAPLEFDSAWFVVRDSSSLDYVLGDGIFYGPVYPGPVRLIWQSPVAFLQDGATVVFGGYSGEVAVGRVP